MGLTIPGNVRPVRIKSLKLHADEKKTFFWEISYARHYNKLHTTNNNSHFLMKDRWQKWKNSGRWKKRVIKREMCAAMCVCVSWMDWLCLFRISHHFRSAGTHKHIMRSSIIRHFSNLDNSNEITLEQSSSYGRTTRLTIHILYNIFFSCEFQKSVNIFIYLLCVCSGFFFWTNVG